MRGTSLRLILILLSFCAMSANVQAGPAAAVAEWLIKQGAKYADDVAGKGLKELTLELEELIARTSDDAVSQLVKQGGPGALKAVRGLGDLVPDAMSLIAKHGAGGRLLIEEGPEVTVSVFREFGDDGIRVLMSQGASKGGKMLSVYGKALAESSLVPTNAAHLRHWLPEIETATPELRTAFNTKLRQGGDDFVVWVAKRWKEVAVVGGLTVAGLTAYKVGDGLAASIPNPANDLTGWMSWWMPVLVIVGIVAIAWVMRHAISAGFAAQANRT